MAVDVLEISLKGDSPVWPAGMGDQSQFAPTLAPFASLQNCFISLDGTEIRNFPGLGLVADPLFMDDGHTLESMVTGPGATETTLHISNIGFDSRLPSGSNFSDSGNLKFWVTGLVPVSGTFTDGLYTGRRDGARSIIITLDSSAWGGVSRTGDERIYFQRKTADADIHGMEWVDGFPVVVAESDYWFQGHLKARSIATWVGSGPLNWEAVDRVWQYWPSPVNELDATTDFTGGQTGIEWGDFKARRRSVLDVTSGRLLIATPGFGYCMSADIRFKNMHNETLPRWTRLLGCPKGDIASSGQSSGWTGNTFSAGSVIHLAVAYKNRHTGEVGLASEISTITTVGVGTRARITVAKPRNVMVECADFSLVVYTSGLNGQAASGFYPIFEQPVDNLVGRYVLDFGPDDIGEDDSWDAFPRFPIIEQMPMGAGWVKTIRGSTFYGGAVAQGIQGIDAHFSQDIYFDEDLESERLRIVKVANSQLRIADHGDHAINGKRGAFAARFKLPSSYQGVEALIPFRPAGTSQNRIQTPVPLRVRLAKKQNAQVWDFDGRFDEVVQISYLDMDVMLPIGHIWHSELEHPGITPAVNRTIFDRIRGKDSRAAGRLGDALVFCTERETYIIRWGRSPRGADPTILSDTYGCCAPNSMIEYPGGLAWLSLEGPAKTGGEPVQWISEAIRAKWDTLKRDSQGMMWHSFGVHDAQRKLLIWGVRSDWNSSTYENLLNDDDKSKVPCDELLIWNYMSNAWSFYRPPGDQGIIDLKDMPSFDGIERVFSLAGDGKIYQYDDRFQDHALDTTVVSATDGSGDSGNTFTAVGTDFTDVLSGTYAFIRDTTGADLKWFGTTNVGADGSITLNDVGSATWASGDIIEIGASFMQIETTLHRHASASTMHQLNAVQIRHKISRTYPSTTENIFNYGNVTLESEDGSQHLLHAETQGRELTGVRTRFEIGYSANEETKIIIKVIGNSRVAIKDIVLEVAQAG